MAKTAERKLTSEERCKKAFEEYFVATAKTEGPIKNALWLGWREAWKYLEARVEEFVKS